MTHFDYDIIIITETWLREYILNSELGLSNFVIYRWDRPPVLGRGQRGGGVLIAVHSRFESELCINSLYSIEQLWVKIRCGHSTLPVCSVYIPPPPSDPLEYDHFGNSYAHDSHLIIYKC